MVGVFCLATAPLGVAAEMATIVISSDTLPTAQVGVDYSKDIGVSGAVSFACVVGSGSMPAGFGLTSGGTIFGTAISANAYTFTIKCTDSGNAANWVEKTFNLTVNAAAPIEVLPATLPNGTKSSAYSQALSVSGYAMGMLSYVVQSGTLPAGVTLSTDGILSGTPTVDGSFTFVVGVTNALATVSGTKSYTWTVDAAGASMLEMSPLTLPAGVVGTAYSQTMTATGGMAPYTWSLASGSMPSGLLLNTSSGAITGTPTTDGTFAFRLRVVDELIRSSEKDYSITVTASAPAGVLTLVPSTLANGNVGSAYSTTVTVSGGTAPYTWFVVGGVLPTGVTLNAASGVLSGTPSSEGTYTFTMKVQDSLAVSTEKAYSITIAGAGVVTLMMSPSTLATATVGAAYSQSLTATGGSAPYVWAITSGSLPTGLTLGTGSGVITGTPSVSGDYALTIRATDASGATTSKTYTLSVTAVGGGSAPFALASGVVGTAYGQTLSVSGGTAPYVWSIVSGSFPPGLSMNFTSGIISGVPTAAGTSAVRVKATDATGRIIEKDYTLTISASAITITVGPSTMPAATVGSSYHQPFTVSGGTAPYVWALANGSLPPGLNVTSNGYLTGTPTSATTASFRVRAYDTNGRTGDRDYSVVVNPAAVATPSSVLTIAPLNMPSAYTGTSYSQTMVATGGSAPYAFSLSPTTQGPLPTGLVLDSRGIISGTPFSIGTYAFRVRVVDAVLRTTEINYQIIVSTSSVTSPLSVFTRLNLAPHNLVKLMDDSNPATQEDTAIYYLGTDGKRHAFPNEKVYFSWFTGFGGLRELQPSEMAQIPLGNNATYRPGNRMVKFTTDPKVYAVALGGVLRWVRTEQIALALYGANWNQRIDDLSDAFFTNYTFGTEVTSAADFIPATVETSVTWVSDSLRM